MYRSLDATRITDTVSLLERRVAERFPGSGLSKVAAEVTGVAQQAMKVTAEIDRPNLLLRAVCGVVIVVIATAITATMAELRLAPGEWTWVAAIPVLESVINELVLLGAGLFFLITLESRIKRGRALKVTVTIPAAPIDRAFTGVAVRLRNVGQGLRGRVEPAAVTVMLHGPGDIVRAIEPRGFDVYVDLADLRPGRHSVPVRLDGIPDGIAVARIEPTMVQVRIQ